MHAYAMPVKALTMITASGKAPVLRRLETFRAAMGFRH
jgi:hypothetical protein